MNPREHLLRAHDLLHDEPKTGEIIANVQQRIVLAQWHMAMAQIGDLLNVANPAEWLRGAQRENEAALHVIAEAATVVDRIVVQQRYIQDPAFGPLRKAVRRWHEVRGVTPGGTVAVEVEDDDD